MKRLTEEDIKSLEAIAKAHADGYKGLIKWIESSCLSAIDDLVFAENLIHIHRLQGQIQTLQDIHKSLNRVINDLRR